MLASMGSVRLPAQLPTDTADKKGRASMHTGTQTQIPSLTSLTSSRLLPVVLAVTALLCLPVQADAGRKKGPAPKDPHRVGVIIALGYGHNVDAKPTLKMVQRVGTAVRAWRQKRAKYIMFCGGYTSGHVAEAEEMMVLAMAMGVPERAIIIENGSISTVQNARNAEKIIDKRRFRSAVLITHKNHMPRAFNAFRKIKRLRKLYKMPADDYVPTGPDVVLDDELENVEQFQAVVIHGKSQAVDFRGNAITLDKTQKSLAQTMAYLYRNGFSKAPFYIWHRAFAVGHITRSEIIGLASIAHGVPGRSLRFGVARRFAAGKRGLFETCQDNGWKRVLSVLPRDREEEVELIEQQYLEQGIEATVILAGKPVVKSRKKKGRRP